MTVEFSIESEKAEATKHHDMNCYVGAVLALYRPSVSDCVTGCT